jgi:hypothetical protein
MQINPLKLTNLIKSPNYILADYAAYANIDDFNTVKGLFKIVFPVHPAV